MPPDDHELEMLARLAKAYHKLNQSEEGSDRPESVTDQSGGEVDQLATPDANEVARLRARVALLEVKYAERREFELEGEMETRKRARRLRWGVGAGIGVAEAEEFMNAIRWLVDFLGTFGGA